MSIVSKQQAGSTLIGFISGLVIGLGIAVIVAIVITKTPMPFLTNKNGDKLKASEVSASQISDPNRPLYGKQEAARQAAKEFEKEAAPADAAQGGKAGEVKTAEGEANKAGPAIVPAKADAKDIVAVKSDEDKYVYYLQAGAFREQADAEGAKAKLALQGFEASISEKPANDGTQGGVLYRVRLGPYSQIDAMNRVRGKLAESGLDVAVVRISK
ncbi:MAG TPA: SPOR domain-containing protein [Paucimonas sp.]|nr:SPOR domain-containing protein [Paucimonas sp.]